MCVRANVGECGGNFGIMGSLEGNLNKGYSQAKAYVDGYNARSKELEEKSLSSEKSLLPVRPSVVDNSAFVDNAFSPYTFQSGGQNYGQGNTYITNNYLVAPGANQSNLPIQNNGIYNPNLDPELNSYQPPQFNLPYQQQVQQQLMQMQQQLANMQEQLMQLIHALMERTGLRDMSYNPNQINPNAYGGNSGEIQGTVDNTQLNGNTGNVQQGHSANVHHQTGLAASNKTEKTNATEETKKPDESGYDDSTMTAEFTHATADAMFSKTAFKIGAATGATAGAVVGGIIGAVGGPLGIAAGAAIGAGVGAVVGVAATAVVGAVATVGAAVVGVVCDIAKGIWDIFA